MTILLLHGKILNIWQLKWVIFNIYNDVFYLQYKIKNYRKFLFIANYLIFNFTYSYDKIVWVPQKMTSQFMLEICAVF